MSYQLRSARVALFALVGLILAASLTSCQSSKKEASFSETAADIAARKEILTAVGEGSALFLIGTESGLLDLGIMNQQGLRPAPVSPRPQLFSMMDSSGTNAVISAGGFEGGATADSFYWIDHGIVKPIGNIDKLGDNAFQPVLNSDQLLAGVGVIHGKTATTYSINVGPFKNGKWDPKKILSAPEIGFISWGPEAQLAVALGDPKSGQDRLKIITKNGAQRDLGRANCTNGQLWGTGQYIALGWVPEEASPAANCGTATLVHSTTGQRIPLPNGWDPLIWSKDNTQLVVSRENEIGLWSPKAAQVTDIMRTPARIYQLARVNKENNILP